MDGHVKTAIAALADIAKNGTSDCNLYTVKTPQDMHPAGDAPPHMDAETPHMDTQTPQDMHPAGDAPPHMDVINPAYGYANPAYGCHKPRRRCTRTIINHH
jgi:hypothetical protein